MNILTRITNLINDWLRPTEPPEIPVELVVVPVEPTEAMIDAACDSDAEAQAKAANAIKFPTLPAYATAGEIFAIQYRAAIAAAPDYQHMMWVEPPKQQP